MVLTRTLGTLKAREIRERTDLRMDLWERSIHAGLVGGTLAQVRAREGHIARINEKEEDCLARNFHIILLSRRLWQAVCWATDHEEGGGIFSWWMFAQRPGDWLQMIYVRNTPTCVYLLWETTCLRPSRITRRCRKGSPLTSQRVMSHGLHPKSQVPLGR